MIMRQVEIDAQRHCDQQDDQLRWNVLRPLSLDEWLEEQNEQADGTDKENLGVGLHQFIRNLRQQF